MLVDLEGAIDPRPQTHIEIREWNVQMPTLRKNRRVGWVLQPSLEEVSEKRVEQNVCTTFTSVWPRSAQLYSS